MSVPALALFYGGLVRSKNMLSVLMQVFVSFSLITVLWCVYGYSLAFTTGNAFFGGFDRAFLSGMFDSATGVFSLGATFSKATPMYEIVFVAFQATFAAITCCLIVGSLVERIKFSGDPAVPRVVVHVQLHPGRAHGLVLGGSGRIHAGADARRLDASAGLIWQWGALDFAGGTVVHINAGVAGLVGAIVLGKRIGYGKEHDDAAQPHDDDDRRFAAVVRLVRVQRRLGARSQVPSRRSRS